VSTSVSPELEELLRKPDTRSPEEAAEADTRKVFERYGKELQAIIAEAVAGDIAAAREAGRREGMEEAILALPIPRPDASPKVLDSNSWHLGYMRAINDAQAAIRAKMEGK